ncbi:TIGR02391 family protein [Kitasatospora sp. NPDC058397]|uniref:TIGR02391 family protein n=1 Tax=unclassified Kitasatospora TaxID=2633591 RepID=UPI00364AA01C
MASSSERTDDFPRVNSEPESLLLQEIFTAHKARGRWPSSKKLNRLFQKSGNSLRSVVAGLPDGLVEGIPDGAGAKVSSIDEVRLTLVGVANCAGSDGVLLLFLQILREAVRKEKDAARWSSERISFSPLESSDVAAACRGLEFRDPVDFLMDVVRSEPWCTDAVRRGGREVIVPAHMSVDSRVRFFAGAQDFRDYWLRRRNFIENYHSLRQRRDLDGLHPEIISVVGSLWSDGHFAQAVLAVFRHIEFRVQNVTGELSESGQSLMAKAFSDPIQGIDVRRANGMSGQSEQAGFKFLFMGAMAGLRNPRAHGSPPEEEESESYEAIAFGSLLLRRLDLAAQRGITTTS